MKILILSILFLCCSAFGYETKGILENMGKEKNVKEGDPFFAKLTLWPYEAQDEKSFYELEGKPLLDFFMVTRVSKVQRSENNNQAVEIHLHLVLKDFFITREFYIFNHRDINIPVELKGINPERRALKTNEFFIKEELPFRENVNWLLYTVPATALLLAMFVLIIRRKKDGKIVVEKYKVVSGVDRKTLEDFYRKRNLVIDTYPEKRREIETLLKKIDMIQYRPSWNEEELKDLKSEYEKVFVMQEEEGENIT